MERILLQGSILQYAWSGEHAGVSVGLGVITLCLVVSCGVRSTLPRALKVLLAIIAEIVVAVLGRRRGVCLST